jgi:hybrid cluster-associated redox disulfide protein
MKITKKTNMNELLMKKPELAELLFSSGMGCIGCPMAEMETIEEGCKAHGMSDKQIEKFVEKLNKEAESKK